MSDIVVCEVRTREGLAEAFAVEVAKKHKSNLEFWKATAMSDKEEYAMWEARIHNEPDIVKERAFNRIMSIMDNPQYNRKFYRKVWMIFVDWSTIRIVPSTGFYRNLLARDITNSIPANVEYLISMKDMSITQIIHSQSDRL